MTSASTPAVPASAVPARAAAVVPGRALPRWVEPARVLTAGAVLSAVLLVVALGGLVLDDRVITGAPAWMKPAKFAVSIALYVLALRWVFSCVRGFGRTKAGVALVVVLGMVAELALITLQVVRGTTSHFNTSTDLDGAVFTAMGLIVSTVFMATVVAAAVSLVRRRELDAGLVAGIGWGLGVALLGMAEAMLMIGNTTSNPSGGHTVGAPDGGPGLPVTGWSLAHGDLRVAHFVGLHALQALPLLAWLLVTRTGLDARTRARLVSVAGAAQAGLVVLLAEQALRGQALLHPDSTTLLALAALTVVTATGALAVLRSRSTTERNHQS